MKNTWVMVSVVVFCTFFMSSCSSMQSAVSAVRPAGYENEKTGWLQKNLPSLETISNMIPPPNDARLKWDETLKKQKDGNRAEQGY